MNTHPVPKRALLSDLYSIDTLDIGNRIRTKKHNVLGGLNSKS